MTGATVGAGVDDRVQVEVLAILEAVHYAVALGTDALELAAHLGEQVGVLRHRPVEEVAGVALERQLAQMAPCGAVVADPVVPLVVDELAGGVARRRRLATPAADVAQGAL